MAGDYYLKIRASESIVFDWPTLQAITADESEYFVLCVHPDVRQLALSAITHFTDWENRWTNFPDESTRLDLIGRAVDQLGAPMACSEDVAEIIAQLTAIAGSQSDINTNLQDQTDRLELKLADIRDNIANLVTTLADVGIEDKVDQLEEILNQVAQILGAIGVVVAP